MILTVTANPAIDLSYRIAKLREGETLRLSRPLTRSGGKGVNVARVIQQTGGEALIVAPVGGNTGNVFSADLDSSGLPARLVPVNAPTRSTFALVSKHSGITTMLAEPGGPLTSAEEQALLRVAAEEILKANFLVGSGSLAEGLSPGFYAELVGVARARGVPALIDTSGSALWLAAEAKANILKANQHEIAETTGESEAVLGARRLLAAGAEQVFVSLGEQGMLAISRESEPIFLAPPEVLSGNPTGAGDAATAAIATGVATGVHESKILLAKAVAWSAAAVLAPLAGELDTRYQSYEKLLTEKDPHGTNPHP